MKIDGIKVLHPMTAQQLQPGLYINGVGTVEKVNIIHHDIAVQERTEKPLGFEKLPKWKREKLCFDESYRQVAYKVCIRLVCGNWRYFQLDELLEVA